MLQKLFSILKDCALPVNLDEENQQQLSFIEDEGFVRAGNDEFWVHAKGTFEEKAVKGYQPNFDSEKLRVELPSFEGPLDLLLYLIQKHALDILDIPIAQITQHYMQSLDHMRKLDLDLAGEFLVMASTLIRLKSKMLLPKDDENATVEEEDPRAALVKRLLLYQSFKHAAAQLALRPRLGRDVFKYSQVAFLNTESHFSEQIVHFDAMHLIRIFEQILKRNKKIIVHEVVREKINIGQRINDMVDFALQRNEFTFRDLINQFGGIQAGKANTIITFISLLEMTKLKLFQIHQAQKNGQIYISTVKENFNVDGMLDAAVDEYDGTTNGK